MILARASNPSKIALAVVVNWDAERYASRLPKKASKKETKAYQERETSLRKRYPPLNGVEVSRPCIIVDMHGVILAWYLPGILKDSRQVGMLTLSNHGSKPDTHQSEIMVATEKLHPMLKKKQKKSNASKACAGTSWRTDPKYFHSGALALKGSINISPAWFQQAHEVSVSARGPFYFIGSLFQMRRRCKNTLRPVHLSSHQPP